MCLLFAQITHREEVFDSRLGSIFPALLTHKCFRMHEELGGQRVLCQMVLTMNRSGRNSFHMIYISLMSNLVKQIVDKSCFTCFLLQEEKMNIKSY